MIEFHIDYWKRITTTLPSSTTIGPSREGTHSDSQPQQIHQKQATTSIRVSSKAMPIMIVGQDESVFAQYLLGSKTWAQMANALSYQDQRAMAAC